MSHELILEGTLGVDARRAAKKIRDHLLANPATWLSELGRVAVLSRASKLAIDLRPASIVVEWNGAPIAAEVIEHFGRHLLAGDDDRDAPTTSSRARTDRRPELLTLAVFAALGDIAAAATISVAGADGVTKARRLTRHELEGALGVQARVASMPREDAFVLLPDATGSVVLELAARVRSVAEWLGIVAPPAAVRELGARMGSGLAVFVDGKQLEPPTDRPVLSIELPPVGDLSVRLDLLESPLVEPRIVFYELGFEIARSALLDPMRPLPVRVVVSGTRVPTNASRSQVDEQVAEGVRRALLAGLPAACEALRTAIVAALAGDDEATHHALEEVAGHAASAALRAGPTDPFRNAFTPVLDWPLLRDAVGRPLGVRDAQRRADGNAIHCRVQSEPLAPEYAPLVGDVIWRRGHSVERAFQLLDYDLIADDVEVGMRRRRHLAANLVPFAPPPCATARSRHRGVTEEGCEWQITLDTTSTGPCMLRLFVGDDLIETREVQHASPLFRFDAAIRWPGVVVAERTLEKIRVDNGFGRLLGLLPRLVNESLLKSLEASDLRVPGPARSLVLRMLQASFSPSAELLALRLWQCGGEVVSTADLRASAQQRYPFFMRRPLAPGELAPAQPVVLVSEEELPLFRAAIGGEVLDYARYATAPRATLETVKRHFTDSGVDCFSFAWRAHMVAVAPARRGRFISLHRGIHLADSALEDGRGVMIAVDGESSLRKESPDWSALYDEAWSRLLRWLTESRARMLGAIAFPMVHDGLRKELRRVIGEGRDRGSLMHWPIFVLRAPGGEQLASVSDIVQRFPGSHHIPTIFEDEPDSGDFLVADQIDRMVVTKITGRACLAPTSRPRARIRPRGPHDERVDPSVFGDAPAVSTEPPAQPWSPAESWRPLKPAAPAAADPAVTLQREAAPAARPAWEPIQPPPVAEVKPLPPSPRTPPPIVPIEQSAGHASAPKTEPAEPPTLEAATARDRAVAPEPVAPPVMAAPPPPVAAPSGAWDRLIALFQKPLREVPSAHPLSLLARRVTQNLYVPNLDLRFSEPGEDPVRFEKRTTTLIVNPLHPIVRVLIENDDVVPLVAAAFSEINRELKVVSDEEERRALGRLLLDLPAE